MCINPPHFRFRTGLVTCFGTRKNIFRAPHFFHRVRPFGRLRRSTEARTRSAAPVATASGRASSARVQNWEVGAAIAPVASTKTMAAVIPPNITSSRACANELARATPSSQLSCQFGPRRMHCRQTAEHGANPPVSARIAAKYDHRVPPGTCGNLVRDAPHGDFSRQLRVVSQPPWPAFDRRRNGRPASCMETTEERATGPERFRTGRAAVASCSSRDREGRGFTWCSRWSRLSTPVFAPAPSSIPECGTERSARCRRAAPRTRPPWQTPSRLHLELPCCRCDSS